jgi:hypothetical protein
MENKNKIIIWSFVVLLILVSVLVGIINYSKKLVGPPVNLFAYFEKSSKLSFPSVISEESDSPKLSNELRSLILNEAKNIMVSSASFSDKTKGIVMRFMLEKPIFESYTQFNTIGKKMATLIYGARGGDTALSDFEGDSFNMRIKFISIDKDSTGVTILINFTK